MKEKKIKKNKDTIDLNQNIVSGGMDNPIIDLRNLKMGYSKVIEWSYELEQWIEVPDDE